MTSDTMHEPISTRLADEFFERYADKGWRSQESGCLSPAVLVAGEDRLVGIAFDPNYRSEEEWGVSDLFKAFMAPREQGVKLLDESERTGSAVIFHGANALVVSKNKIGWDALEWGDRISDPDTAETSHVGYNAMFDNQLEYAQKIPSDFDLTRRDVKMAWLKGIAQVCGIDKPARSKAALAEQIIASGRLNEYRERPDVWPAWFRDGHDLVLRADAGACATIINGLRDAAQAGTIAIGGASFGNGYQLVVYDYRDLTPALIEKMEQNVAKRMGK